MYKIQVNRKSATLFEQRFIKNHMMFVETEAIAGGYEQVNEMVKSWMVEFKVPKDRIEGIEFLHQMRRKRHVTI